MPPPSTHGSAALHPPSFWSLQLIGWGGLMAVTVPLKQVAFGSFGAALLLTTYQLPLSLLLSAGLRLLYRRAQATARPVSTVAALVVFASLVAGLVDVALSLPLNNLLDIPDPTGVAETGMFAFRCAIYLIWSLAYFLFKSLLQSREQAFQAAVSAERHRFELLRYQLNPSFLANSLRTISREISFNRDNARVMTERLADFYQQTLRHADRGLTATIGDEVALVRTYLEIEQLRLGPALQVKLEVDDTLAPLAVPPVLLLPLAEQAVKESTVTPEHPLEITVTVQRTEDGMVLLEVSDTGRLHAGRKASFNTSSPDVRNVRAALERHFPGQHRFAVSQDSLRVRSSLRLALSR